MKLKMSLLAFVVLASAALLVAGVRTTEAKATKVMVVHITSEQIAPGSPFITYPEPGLYTVFASGKVIEVADQAAQVLVAKGDVLVSDLYGDEDTLPQKGDNVDIVMLLEVLSDGTEVRSNPQLALN